LAIDATGSAYGFTLPDGVQESGAFRLEWFVTRPGATPLGLAHGPAQTDPWFLVDPATGASIKLAFGWKQGPTGVGGADPNLVLLQTSSSGLDDSLTLALADLKLGEAMELGDVDLGGEHGAIVAFGYPYAYLMIPNPLADPSGPAELWQIDLREAPLTPRKPLALNRNAQIEAAGGALLVQRAGSEQASLVDLATGGVEELPIPVVGTHAPYPIASLSPDGALIAFLRPQGAELQELMVYERATGETRLLLDGLRLGEPGDARWAADGRSLLVLPRSGFGGHGQFTARDLSVIALRLDGMGGARSLELRGVDEVAPLGEDHLLVLRDGWLEAPALDGGPPSFEPLPIRGAYPAARLLLHVP
ncbi:MAG TPA: hypothetical protein VGE07_16085, partial [Herpetosiphonaceae bacterium]